jgi:hypothetical protein
MIQYCLIKKIVLLVTVEKIDLNPISINVTKNYNASGFLDLANKGLEAQIQWERDGIPGTSLEIFSNLTLWKIMHGF